MNPRACRRKGKEFERAVRSRLACVFGEALVKRGVQFEGGALAADVSAPRLWVECKAGKLTNPRKALRQAARDSNGQRVWPVAVCKDDGNKPVVTMRFEDWVDLLSEWHALKMQ
jgi:hypothetical protein